MTASTTTLEIAISLFAIYTIVAFYKRTASPQPKLPPGPKPWPIIGNLLDVPLSRSWETYAHWQKIYGNIVQFNFFGQTVIVLNSREAAIDLLEKRSSIYSDRPHIPIVGLMGWDFALPFMRYGDNWRRHRRIFHQKFRPEAAITFRPIQMRNVHHLLCRLTENPDDFMDCLRTFSASIVMYSMYGHQIAQADDDYVKLAEEAIHSVLDSVSPGLMAVNALPILRHLPAWFPGGGFQELAQRCSKITRNMRDVPFEKVKRNMNTGTAVRCVTSELLVRHETMGGSQEEEEVIKGVSAVAYAAGADTTTSGIAKIILFLVLYPEVQKRAQQEIDKVIGAHRLPEAGDRDWLPYVEAFYREVSRWHPSLPLGVVHSTSDSDVYNGYYIPKGAYIMANSWAMTHDASVYPEPHAFTPERFLTPEGQLKPNSQIDSFGFGRRICPGRHMGDFTVWATMVSLIAVFNFAKAKDSAGNEIEVKAEFVDGILSHPLPFVCSITPRSVATRKLVEETTFLHGMA